MDAVLTAALQSLPPLGIMGGLGWLVVVLFRRESSTEERHTAELNRVNAAHDAELAELRADITRERIARREAQQELDDIRKGTA